MLTYFALHLETISFPKNLLIIIRDYLHVWFLLLFAFHLKRRICNPHNNYRAIQVTMSFPKKTRILFFFLANYLVCPSSDNPLTRQLCNKLL